MEIKLFYKTQRELADAINKLVDSYWNNEIGESDLVTHLISLYVNNNSKIKKNDEFTAVLKQQCGKRRLEVFERIILMDENGK